jgi:hypothetical protein
MPIRQFFLTLPRVSLAAIHTPSTKSKLSRLVTRIQSKVDNCPNSTHTELSQATRLVMDHILYTLSVDRKTASEIT